MMKKLISVMVAILIVLQSFAGTGGWNNYPTVDTLSGPETFLLGTSSTNELISFTYLTSTIQAKLPYNTNAFQIMLSYNGSDTSNLLVDLSPFTNSGKVVFGLVLTNNTFIHLTNYPSGASLQIQFYQNSIGTYQRYYDSTLCPAGAPPIGTNALKMNSDMISTYGLTGPYHYFVGQCTTNAN